MVKVDIEYQVSGKFLESIDVSGHADSAPYPHDLVCAAVSAIAVGAMNALEDVDGKYDIEIEDGHVSFKANKSLTEHDNTVLETMIIQLKTIELSYKNTIKIKERK